MKSSRRIAFAVASWGLLLACSRDAPPTGSAPAGLRGPPAASSPRPEPAQEEGESFVPAHDADAVEQPGSHGTVAHLVAGKTYKLLKRGGPGRAWCKVAAEGADGWVLCSHAERGAPPSPDDSTVPSTSGASGKFDYYLLTLSWSPAFCETPAGARSEEQCGPGRHYAFVVHGLWPQNERGWPEDCGASAPLREDDVKRMLDIMPSEKLVRHEWEKHGTCSGLPAERYFERLRAAFTSIHIPAAYLQPKQPFTTDLDEIVEAFTKANPGVTRDGMAVACKHQLDEVRFCLDRDLKPRTCSADVRNTCKGKVTVPPTR